MAEKDKDQNRENQDSPDNNEQVKNDEDYTDRNITDPFEYESGLAKTKSGNTKKILGIAVAAILLSAIVPFFYFQLQDTNSSPIQNNLTENTDERLAQKYGVGVLGDDHAHAAVIVFVNEERINFGLSQFQLQSKYIHFENQNPYLVHRHSTNVPLGMLFDSIDMKVTQDCIKLNYDEINNDIISGRFCSGDKVENKLQIYINGRLYNSNISEYVFGHEDRILVSFGTGSENIIQKQLKYLDSLQIYDIPDEDGERQSPQTGIQI